jgi:glycosyltransferase involved in cell wall biosynthesis
LAALPGAVAAALLRSSLRGTGSERPWLINAGHSGLEHAHWARRLREQGARPLLVVHDLIPITHPQYCRAGEADRHAQRMRHALGWAAAVVANSQATLDTLAGWAISQGLTLPAATVAHLGPGSGSGWAAGGGAGDARPLPGPYFVVLGTLEPRKNHALLLRVWERLVQALGAQAVPRLVLIGQRGWDIEALLRDLAHSPGLQGVVLERPRCSDAELARWLRHARALLLPSFAEGYGMPLVEALAAGVPVLASELPVFREVAGAVPDYLDPLDGPAWLAAVTAYAAPDCEARRAQLERMQGFCAPTWARHFAVVDKLIASGLPA